MVKLNEHVGFDWDAGNRAKCRKHGLSIEQIEQVFESTIAILPDVGHSQGEQRFGAVGRDPEGRAVFVVFTMRRRGELARSSDQRAIHASQGDHDL